LKVIIRTVTHTHTHAHTRTHTTDRLLYTATKVVGSNNTLITD